MQAHARILWTSKTSILLDLSLNLRHKVLFLMCQLQRALEELRPTQVSQEMQTNEASWSLSFPTEFVGQSHSFQESKEAPSPSYF